MKLTKSIPLAKQYMTVMPLGESERDDFARYVVSMNNLVMLKAARPNLAYAWAIWNYLKPIQRKLIVVESVGEADIVGDYFQSVNNSHIDALLRKVITPVVRARQVAWAETRLANTDAKEN